MAPSLMLNLSFQSNAATTESLVPRPWQAGQAPNGELKEKCFGSKSGREKPLAAQLQIVEQITSVFLPFASVNTLTKPLLKSSAFLTCFCNSNFSFLSRTLGIVFFGETSVWAMTIESECKPSGMVSA